MIPEYTFNLYTNVFLHAAHLLDLEYEILDADRAYCRVSKGPQSIFIYGCSVSCNSATANRAADNKFINLRNLALAGLPVPEHRLFTSPSAVWSDPEIERIAHYAKERYPLVLKGIHGLGGRMVFANLESEVEVIQATDEFRSEGHRHILAEQHIMGRHYRLIMAKGQLIDVTERVPAYVDGDGETKLNNLVERKNAARKAVHLSAIQIDKDTQRVLRKAGLALDDIPALGVRVTLKNKCNLSVGGEERLIDVDEVPESNRRLFAEVAEASRLVYVGLDVIAGDITSDCAEDCVINEINASSAPNYIEQAPDSEDALLMPTRLFQVLFDL